MSAILDSLSIGLLRDWMASALGKQVGSGIGRQVFVYDLNPHFVIKIEQTGFQNAIEWEIWRSVSSTTYARWFAPCRHISPCGMLLLMERTLPAERSKYPKRMPMFLGDYKYSNYGLLRGKLVCHDYGSMLAAHNGLSSKMRRADWWDANDGSTFDDRRKHT